MRSLACAGLLALSVACGREPGASLSTEPGGTSSFLSSGAGAESTTGSSSSSTGAEDSAASTSTSSTGAALDMATPPDFGDIQPAGCAGKIDFLFLIAREAQMKAEQEQLIASLPGFIQTIEESFPGFDMHIMVANPDGTWPGWLCEKATVCGEYGYCGPNGLDYQCGSGDLIGPCDEALGAGIVFNAGAYATNYPCELSGGRRYMTVPGEPDPATAFDCIARVGTSGTWTMGDAMVAAVSPELNEGGCNDGFLREDALLVITTISDSEDQESKSQPAAWYDAIVAAKGDPAAAVMLAITAQPLVGEEQPDCVYNPVGYAKILDLNERFPFHVEGDICAPSYVPFFAEAAELVGEACDSFIPK